MGLYVCTSGVGSEWCGMVCYLLDASWLAPSASDVLEDAWFLQDAASVAKVEAGLQHAKQYSALFESVVHRFCKLGAEQVRAATEARFQTPSFQACPFGLNCQVFGRLHAVTSLHPQCTVEAQFLAEDAA